MPHSGHVIRRGGFVEKGETQARQGCSRAHCEMQPGCACKHVAVTVLVCGHCACTACLCLPYTCICMTSLSERHLSTVILKEKVAGVYVERHLMMGNLDIANPQQLTNQP